MNVFNRNLLWILKLSLHVIFQGLGSGYPLDTLTFIQMGAQTNLGARKTGGEAYITLEMESSTVSIEGLTIYDYI